MIIHHALPRPVLALVAALFISLAAAPGAGATSAPPAFAAAPAAAPAPAWDGSIDLYRKSAFTTQKTWLWCTAAGVQIVRNIVERDDDHSTRAQRDYFAWMRRHNHYDLPEAAGVDPAGWTAGLRHFVDDRYRLVASTTFSAALRSAAARLRATGLPVALTVANGGHGWILTGFSATADPLKTKKFTVKSVRVVGPLYGRQSRNGYDMKPGTSLTPRQLRRFFTPWRYAPKPMVWDGKYVSIQPVPRKVAAAPVAAAPAPSAIATPPTAPEGGESSRPSTTLPAAPVSAIAGPSFTPVPRSGPAPLDGSSTGVFVLFFGLTLSLALVAGIRRSRSRTPPH